ncbi:MAG: Hsp20 family protein [Proteobacteria bacterium]|nr:Hsp20 family protein [Pseudomonadota bacterium]
MANLLTLTTPLMRQTVGFDRLNDMFERLMVDTNEGFDNYPPYNIDRIGEDKYRITMAVAGFTLDDLNIVLQDGALTVSGTNKERAAETDVQILHRGIAARAFQKTFRLADFIQVSGADIKDGLLTIHLVREVPEEKKPRTIPIQTDDAGRQQTIDNKKSGS